MRAIEIIEGVYAVGGPDLTGMDDAYIYLVDFGDEQVLIDAGAGGATDRLMSNIKDALKKEANISHLILTHNHIDHVGGAEDIRSRTGAKIAVHENDAPALESGDPERTAASWYGVTLAPMKIDILLKGEGGDFETGSGALHWIHTPGHTPGSISVLLKCKGNKILFGQDIHGPFMPQFGSDKKQWRESMRRLIALEPDILCEGHYGIYKSPERVKEFILSFFDKI
ncbi:MAG: MBL fold metallo-hydrolase [bacterium]